MTLDQYWVETARFVNAHGGPDCAAIAPREFRGSIPTVVPYEHATTTSLQAARFLVLHKGLVEEIPRHVLYAGLTFGQVVFGNDVFLVLALRWEAVASHLKDVLRLTHGLAAKPFAVDTQRSPEATRPTSDRRTTCYLGGHRAVCTTVFGHKMMVDTTDLSLTPHLLTDGFWEHWITAFIKRTVRPGWRVVEIGANIGYYTLLLADGVGPQGSVVAFEANPHLCDILRTNVEINGFRDRAKAVAAVVTNASKTATEFRLYRRHLADSSLFATSERAEAFADDLETIDVAAVALDDYFEAEGRIDFVKIDAEGAEPLILQGARRLLAAQPHVMMLVELVPEYVQKTMRPAEFLNYIRALGFTIVRVDEDGRTRHAPDDELLAHNYSELFLERPV